MICVGEKISQFNLPGFYSGKTKSYSNSDFKGKWWILFFYPKDFTFVCPTEVIGFSKRMEDFKKLKVEVLGISCDPPATHQAWAKELGGINYPLLSDEDKKLSQQLNVLHTEENLPLRATFIIDPQGVIQYEMISHTNVGRSVDETYRVVAALQTGRMCPADWKPGEDTFDVSNKY